MRGNAKSTVNKQLDHRNLYLNSDSEHSLTDEEDYVEDK